MALTKEQIAKRTAKAKATREAKKKAALKTLGLEQYDRSKKPRKKRTMTPEQKAAATARLEKARAARQPAQNNQIDESVRDLPPDHPFSYKNVRKWQQEAKAYVRTIKSFEESKDANERHAYQRAVAYVTNIGTYLRTGVWVDSHYGSSMQHKIKLRCTHLAYNKDGTVKRTLGVWYPDIGCEWTMEMELNV